MTMGEPGGNGKSYNRQTIREREAARTAEERRMFGVKTWRCRHCRYQVAERDLRAHLIERCPKRPAEATRGGMAIEQHFEPVT